MVSFDVKPAHIGVIVEDIDKAIDFYSSTLNVGPWQSYGELQENALYYGQPHKLCYKAAMAPMGDMQLELIQPTQKNSVFYDDLEKKGPGIHHISVLVDDIEKTVKECKANGFEIIDYVPMYEMEPGFSLGFCFIDSDKFGGMKLELVQEVISK